MLNFYKISFNSLIVALVALQQSYAVQSLETLSWDAILQEAYYAYHDSNTITEDEAIVLLENIQQRTNAQSDRYAIIDFQSQLKTPNSLSILDCLSAINSEHPYYFAINILNVDSYQRVQHTSYSSDKRSLIYSKNLQLRI